MCRGKPWNLVRLSIWPKVDRDEIQTWMFDLKFLLFFFVMELHCAKRKTHKQEKDTEIK